MNDYKKRYKYRRTIMFLSRLVLLASLILEFVYVWQNKYEQTVFFNKGNYVVVLIYSVLFFVFNQMYGGFRIGRYRRNEVIYSNSLSVLISNVLIYLQLSLMDSALLNIGPIVLLTVIQIITIFILIIIINKIYFSIYSVRNVVLICKDEKDTLHLSNKIKKIREKYKIIATYTQDEISIKTLESTDNIGSVMIGDVDLNIRKKIVEYCYDKDIRVYIIPSVEDILLNSAERTQIFDTPVLLSRNYHLTQEQRIAKRAIDIILSSIGIVISSPFMLFTAVAVFLYDRHSPIYKQVRVTKDNREFNLYKFRSMVIDAEKEGKARLSTKSDPRITPIGKIIRATRLDELPQLFNILKGDMSIVGPRPERPEIIKQYVEKYPDFKYRTKMQAGLTGYAQVMGKYNTTPQDKLRFDLIYIEKYSILLDFKLMFLTFKIMFMKDSTEGIDEGQTTADSEE